MSATSSWMPGGQPSTTQPIAAPWLSPQVVMRKRWPKLLCDMGFLCAQVPTLSLPAEPLSPWGRAGASRTRLALVDHRDVGNVLVLHPSLSAVNLSRVIPILR